MKKILALLFALLAVPAGAQVIPSGPNGSLNYWGVGGLSQVLNPGLAGQCLTTQGIGSAPVWVNCQVSSLSLLPPINTNQFYGNVSGQFSPPVGVDVNTILNTVGYDIARPPPVEAIIYKSSVGPLFNWQALPPGTPGSLLTSGGPTNPPFWAPSPAQGNLAAICQIVGAFLYFDTPSSLWKCLSPGTAGQVLQTGGAGANPSYLTLSGTAPLNYSSGAFSIAANGITNSLLAQVPANTVKCNSTGSTGNAQDCPKPWAYITDPVFGAVADGATDAGPAINNCISAGFDCIVPPSTLGFFINTTINNTGSLRGTVFRPNNPSPGATFPGSSFLLCSASVTPCLLNGGSNNVSSYLGDLIVSRVAGTPAAGKIGIEWNNGYNHTSKNVYAFNHDTCLEWLAAPGGIASHNVNLQAALCATNFMVDDGWPEIQINGGRFGANGTGDYSTAQNYVLLQNSACPSGGCGPNTLTIENFQMNASANGPQCAFRWANFTNPTSSTIGSETKLTDLHIEWHTSGTGVFCSDATATTIQQVYVSHVETVTAGTVPLFALNAATNLTQWFVADSIFGGCSGITLAPTPASGPSFSDVHFSRVFGCVSASFTSNGVGSNRLFLSDNNWGTLTVAGSWNYLSSMNDVYSSLTDTASGNVSWANPNAQLWTPVLQFGGATTGITYSTQFGAFSRTADSGYAAAFSIILTSNGSATGTATIAGLPKQCANGAESTAAGAPSAWFFNMSGLTGPPLISIGGGTTTLNLDTTNAGGTGITSLANTNFSSTTQLNGTVKCAHTL